MTYGTYYGRGGVHTARRGKSNSILLVALNRPRVKNAFSDELYLDLIKILRSAAEDETIAAVVLTGTGSYFSSGANMKQSFSPDGEAKSIRMLDKPPGIFMMELIRFPKLIAAAVNGPAVGMGVTLLLHCDLCYCTESATFWVPFTRLALVPQFCSSMTLVERMGLSKANDLLLLGKKIDADAAVQNNICSEVIRGCDDSGDPFHENSLASRLCWEIDEKLLSLPLGGKTSRVFVSMVRGRRRKHLEELCKEELGKLDGRFDNGECLEAAMHLNVKQNIRSRL